MANEAFLVNALPYIRAAVEDMKKVTVQRAMALIRERKLTPEVALGLWMELFSSEDLMRRMDKRVRPAVTETVNG